MDTSARHFEVIIVGAGVIGASVAYHLCRLGTTNVLLLEREEFPGTGSTSKANGGIRAQFTTTINIQMSLLSMRLLDEMDEEMQRQSGYLKAGYLFVTADRERMRLLVQVVRMQQEHGVAVALLTADEIATRFPFLKTSDLAGGTFGSRDGFIDPNGLTLAYLTQALALGAQFRPRTAVVDLLRQDRRVTGVKTSAGEFTADYVVNCAGPEAATLAAMAGCDLPVEPVRRQIVVTGPVETVPHLLPMTIDLDTKLVIRREGEGLGLAYSNPEEPPGLHLRFDPDFVEVVAPKMLARLPQLEEVGFDFSRSRAGLYEVTPDHHAILGESNVYGFLLCNGFSGHGVMHAPAAGLVLAEHVVRGHSESLDISPLSLRRFAEDRLLHEAAVF